MPVESDVDVISNRDATAPDVSAQTRAEVLQAAIDDDVTGATSTDGNANSSTDGAPTPEDDSPDVRTPNIGEETPDIDMGPAPEFPTPEWDQPDSGGIASETAPPDVTVGTPAIDDPDVEY